MITGHHLRWLGAITIIGAAGAIVGGIHNYTWKPPANHQLSATIANANYGKLPLAFEPNLGQTDSQVRYIARARGCTLFLTPRETVLLLKSRSSNHNARPAIIRMSMQGSSANPSLSGTDKLPGHSNYFIGDNPKLWKRNVPQYARVAMNQPYPGINSVFYGNQGQLEQDFIVSPGANPDTICLQFSGIGKNQPVLSITPSGDLSLRLNDGTLSLKKPVAYQDVNKHHEVVPARYKLIDKNHVAFDLARYDVQKPLVIDPILTYSTYLGGSGDESANAIAVDASGKAYIAGETTSANFPLVNQVQTYAGGKDAFVSCFAAGGKALLYSTYVGGTGDDIATGIAVDTSGAAYVCGSTNSALSFPITANSFQTSSHGLSDAFAFKVAPGGSTLSYSTFLGGSLDDQATCIAVDTAGNATIAGWTKSTNYPVTSGALQVTSAGGQDGFITRLNSTGTAALYSTYLGGSGNDAINAIALDAAGDTYVTGSTASAAFPTVNPISTTGSAFISEIDPRGAALLYSTCLSSTTAGTGIAVDANHFIYAVGTTSSATFGTTPGSVQSTAGGGVDSWVAKIDPSQVGAASLLYATYLGGSNDDFATAIAVDAYQNAVVVGYTLSTDFPTQNALQANNSGGQDAFVTKLNSMGTAYVYSTYLGGSSDDAAMGVALDSVGNAYVAGWTTSTNFPIATPVQPANGGGQDAFIAELTDSPQTPANLTATGISATEIDLSWTDSQTNQTAFQIFRKPGLPTDPGQYVLVGTVGPTQYSFDDTSLPQVGTYTYEVAATNTAGTSTPTVITVPMPPTGLTVTSTSQSSITLQWTDTNTDFTGFEVERSIGTAPYSVVAALGSAATTYTDANLAAASSYQYEIVAINRNGSGLGISVPSSGVTGTTMPAIPAAPSNLAATPVSQTEIDLQWTPNGSNQTGFKVQRAVATTGPWTTIGLTGPAIVTFQDRGLTPNTTYYYQVLATNTGPDSVASNTANATTFPVPPTSASNLLATPVSNTEIDLSFAWNGTGSVPSTFQVQRQIGTNGFQTVGSVAYVAAQTAYTFNDTSLLANTTYTYQIIASNTGGSAQPSNSATATTFINPPSNPTSLMAQAISQTEIDLSWSDNNGDYTGFIVQEQSGTGTYTQIATVQAQTGVVTYTLKVTGLTPGAIYNFQVLATNAGGSSVPSATVTQATIPNPPAAPVQLTGTVVSQTQITLNWTDASGDFTGSIIERKMGNSAFTQVGILSSTAVTFTDSGLTANTTYTYRVLATNAGGSSIPSNEWSGTTQPNPPSAPSNLTATVLSQTSVGLAWTDTNTDYTGFQIFRQAGAGPFTQVGGTLSATTMSFTDIGLTPNTTYVYEVVAVNAGGSSAYSNQATALTLPNAPLPPNTLTAVVPAAPAGQSEIDLTWTDTNADFTSFKVERQSGTTPFTVISTTTATTLTFSDTGLQPGTTYTYEIVASNAGGDSLPSAQATATTLPSLPAAPTGLTVTAISATQVNLSWIDNSNNETGFTVQRQDTPTGPFNTVATLAPNTTSYSDTGLTASTTYTYQVVAFNTSGNSSATAAVSIQTLPLPPASPTALTATPLSANQVALQWTDTAADETGFIIQRSTNGAAYTQVGVVNSTATSYTDTGLSPSTSYSYQVIATNTGGSSAPSNTATVTTLPGPPAAISNLAASVISQTEIDLTWTDSSGTATQFIVQREDPGSTTFGVIATLTAPASSYKDTGLTQNSQYTYRIIAVNAGGDSQPSNTVIAVTKPGPPVAPSNLNAVTVSATSISLFWTDNSNNETGFNILRQTGSTGGFVLVKSVGSNVTTWTDTGLQSNTTYTYEVESVNVTAISAPSAPASATTLLVAPAAPTNLTATVISYSEVDLKWQDNSNNEAGFEIERQITSTGSFVLIATLGPNATSFQDQSVSPNAAYGYRVRAYNNGGNSAYTNQAYGTTPPQPPVNLAAVAVGPNQVNLTWNPGGTLPTRYKILRSTGAGAFAVIASMSGSVNAFSDVTTQANSTYNYQVVATGLVDSAPSNTVTVTTTPALPSSPTNLTAAALSQSSIQLNWKNTAASATGIVIQRSSGGSAYTQIAQVAGSVTSYTDTNLSPATTYTYEVYSINTGGNSAFSNPASTMTRGADTLSGTVNVGTGTVIAAVSGMTVQLKDATGATILQTATTSATGTYSFNVIDGTYTLSVVPQPGQSAVAPLTVTVHGGNSVNNNFTLAPQYTFPIGVTMASVPYSYATTPVDAATLLGTTLIAAYSPSQNNYLLYPSLPGTNLTPGQGYWIKETAAQMFHSVGQAVQSPFQITLQPGWNMVGDPFTSSITISSIQVTSPTLTGTVSMSTAISSNIIGSTVWTYNATTAAYQAATTLDPFNGYWIWVNSTVVGTNSIQLTLTSSGS